MAEFNNNQNDAIINGTDYEDNIFSSGINVQIYGGSGDDKIENRGYEVTIDAGSGNDSIWTDVYSSYGISNYRSATVYGGDGDDTITVRDNETSLNGGAGSDIISVYSSNWDNNTLQGGKENDTIYGGGKNVFVYKSGDGNDTIYYAQSNDTIQIATNSGYETLVSDYDLIVKVDDGKMTFKNAYYKSFNIVTVPYEDSEEDLRTLSAQAFKSFVSIGKGTDSTPADTTNTNAAKIAESEIDIIRFLGKTFTAMTKYKHDANGNVVTDGNGKPVEDDTTSKAIIETGYNAILSLESIIKSTNAIMEGNLSKTEIITEIGNISSEIANIATYINDLKKNSTGASLATSISSGLDLVTNVITCFTDGPSIPEVGNIIADVTEISAEVITLSGTSGPFAGTSLGSFLATNSGGRKVAEFVENNHVGTVVSVISGVFTSFDKLFKNIEAYEMDGLPKSAAIANSCIDVIESAVHTFSNAFMLETVRVDADTIFKGVHTLAATIKWSFQNGLALATGGDTSQIEFTTTDKTFTEIIANQLKALITGTTEASDIFNEKNRKKFRAIKGNKHVTNYGSYCTITTGAGEDLVFNHEGTQSNDIDTGNNNDFICIYGPSNTVRGGQGADKISLYSDDKAPAGGNKIYGDTGDDYILINDSRYQTLPRRSNNTVIGGEGNDLIIIEDTNIPVIIRYNSGDGKDNIYGYENNDTIQIINSDYSTSNSGQDVIITVDMGTIKLIDAKGKTLNIEKISDNSLPDGISYDKNKTMLTVNKSKFRGEQIDLAKFDPSVKKINASSMINAVNITGNAADNYIKGGKGNDTLNGGLGQDTLLGANGNDTIYGLNGDDVIDGGKGDDYIIGGVGNDILKGGSGNDTISGGQGNDTLKGGSGADTFVYSAGNDTITDYTAKDELKFDTAINSVTVNKKNVTFHTDSGSLTVKNGKGKTITTTDENGNRNTQKYNTSSYEATKVTEPWFVKNYNFVTKDSITDLAVSLNVESHSVGKVESFNLPNHDANDLIKISYVKDSEKVTNALCNMMN